VQVTVDVLNGSGDLFYTRKIADQINGLAYHLSPSIRKADNFDYKTTPSTTRPTRGHRKPPGGLALRRHETAPGRQGSPPAGRDRRPGDRLELLI
jgi:hypothetical protein